MNPISLGEIYTWNAGGGNIGRNKKNFIPSKRYQVEAKVVKIVRATITLRDINEEGIIWKTGTQWLLDNATCTLVEDAPDVLNT